MKNIKKNEIMNKKVLFLLNNTNNIKKNKTSYLSFITNDFSKNYKSKNNFQFRNIPFLNRINQRFFHLYSIEHTSHDEKLKKFKNNYSSNTNSIFLTNNQNDFNNPNNINTTRRENKNNYTLLKKLFPNLEELNLYSNIPLCPFNNDENNKNYNRKDELKKRIYNYYHKKTRLKPNKLNVFPKELLNYSSNINYDEKNKTYEPNMKDIFFKHLKFIKNKNSKLRFEGKSHKFINEKTSNLKPTIINFNNKYVIQNKKIHINRKNFFSNNIFKNKEIKKYFSNTIFPNIYNQNSKNNYKSIKIYKNRSYIKSTDNLLEHNSINELELSNNSLSHHQFDKIQSLISRNKNKFIKKTNRNKSNSNIKFEEKGTNTIEIISN